jgi:hypothetical protein
MTKLFTITVTILVLTAPAFAADRSGFKPRRDRGRPAHTVSTGTGVVTEWPTPGDTGAPETDRAGGTRFQKSCQGGGWCPDPKRGRAGGTLVGGTSAQ